MTKSREETDDFVNLKEKEAFFVYLREAGGLRVSQTRRQQTGHEAAGVAGGDNVT